MAGELELKQEEIIRKDNTIIFFEYGSDWANFNQYCLHDELIKKLDSEEIYIEDINLSELALIDTASILNLEGAIFELKELYFPDLDNLVSDTNFIIDNNSFDRINNLKDIISHKEAEYSLSILNLVKDLISEILSIQGKDVIFIKEENLKNTSFIEDSKVKPIKVNKEKITFLHTYIGKFDVPLENLALQSLIELSNII